MDFGEKCTIVKVWEEEGGGVFGGNTWFTVRTGGRLVVSNRVCRWAIKN